MNVGHTRPEDAQEGDLHVRVPAVAGRLTGLRHALAEWSERAGLPPDDSEALILASYEAMANTVEHAYIGQLQGVLDLRAVRDLARGCVTVTVTDYGRWKPPPADPGTRGRGLPLIRGLTATAAITPSTTGTTVAMSWPLPTKP
ncbi:MAG: ATP-binding protein [Actinophytocola sp.]|uniref:ATP-binding protein n=1 Tax=Actinophytocola sp. TaxID=1872138 RepID=UPI00132AD7B7|nr:ATP-binding protein [Actinophytocola sp.]MPZ84997.1 ATP-binding protein [Actinophytocola sp.]